MADSVGIDRRTGQVLTDWAHVVQSIEDILTTRVLSRVMLRQYGSELPELIDAPMNDRTVLLVYAAIATALDAWEPRLHLTDVNIAEAGSDGRITLLISGIYIPRGHYGDETQAGAFDARFVQVGQSFQVLV